MKIIEWSKLSWKTEFKDWVRQDRLFDALIYSSGFPKIFEDFLIKILQSRINDWCNCLPCLFNNMNEIQALWADLAWIWTHHNLLMCHRKTKQYFKMSFPVSSRFLLTGNKLSSHFMCRSIISWTPYNKLLQVLKWSLLWSLLLFCFSPASALAELRKMSLETK